MKTIITRLKPGSKLKLQIQKLVKTHRVQAGYIITCVGGLQYAVCRMAGAKPNQQDICEFSGEFEIVSLVGTVSTNGCHLHISFSDRDGKVQGGHLKEAIVSSTAEVVIGVEEHLTFERKRDEQTGFKELHIS